MYPSLRLRHYNVHVFFQTWQPEDLSRISKRKCTIGILTLPGDAYALIPRGFGLDQRLSQLCHVPLYETDSGTPHIWSISMYIRSADIDGLYSVYLAIGLHGLESRFGMSDVTTRATLHGVLPGSAARDRLRAYCCLGRHERCDWPG